MRDFFEIGWAGFKFIFAGAALAILGMSAIVLTLELIKGLFQ